MSRKAREALRVKFSLIEMFCFLFDKTVSIPPFFCGGKALQSVKWSINDSFGNKRQLSQSVFVGAGLGHAPPEDFEI